MPGPSLMRSRLRVAVALGAAWIGMTASPARVGARPEPDQPAPEWEAFTAEFAAAATHAARIVRWADQERARIREEHAARMRGREMYREGYFRAWTPAHHAARFDASHAEQRRRQARLSSLAVEWDQAWYVPVYAPPSIFDALGVRGGREPGAPAPPHERMDPAQLGVRLPQVRAEVDEIVLRSVTAVWHDRLSLTGLRDFNADLADSWGETSAIAAEAQHKLDRLAPAWRASEAKSERRAGIEAQQHAIVGDRGLVARIEAMVADLEPLRLGCAQQLVAWGETAPKLYLAGPQAHRQAHLDGLSRYLDAIFQRDFTLLIDTSSWMNADETEPHYAAPVRVHKNRVSPWNLGEAATLYVRPEFAGNLRELVALHAAPGRMIGHRRTMPEARGGKPHVFAAVVVSEALSVDPVERLLNAGAPPTAPSAEPGVTLLVLGVNLLGDEASRFREPKIESDSTRIGYQRIGAVRGIHALPDDHPLRAVYRSGVGKATRGLALRDAAPMHLMDALLFNVRLGPGLMRGYRTLRIDGADAIWPLSRATSSASLSFVRERPTRLADEVDHPDEFFVFDRFCVEVRTEHELEAAELRLTVVHNDGRLALRTSADASGDGTMIARKVAGFPTRFRTKPVCIEPRGQATPPAGDEPGVHYAQMSRGDRLMATTEAPLFAAPIADFAEVHLTPGDLRLGGGPGRAAAPGPGEAPLAAGSLLFSEAVARACEMHKVHLPNLNLGDDAVVDTLTHTIVFNWQRHRIEFSLLDHAAMLLMKRTFLQLADERLRALRTLHADDNLVRAHVPVLAEQFRAWMRQASDAGDNRAYPLLTKSLRVAMNDGRTPYGRLTARGRRAWHPEGYPLTWAFQDSDAWWAEHFERAEMLGAFRVDATREALRLQIDETQRAIAHAKAAADDDLEALLELTGRGFDSIVQRIVPRLMYLESNAVTQVRRWKPHERARAAIVRLGNTLAEHETAGKAAREDTEAILAVISAVGLGAGANLVGKTVLALGSGLGAAAAAKDVLQLHEDQAEVRFAADALEILGRERLELGLAQRGIGVMPYVSAALSVVGFRFDLADAVAVVKAAQARRVAERWMPHVAREGFEALGQVPIQDKTLIYLMMKEAEEAAAAGQRLNAAQQAAIEAQRRIEFQLTAPHPYGYPHLDDHALRSAKTEVEVGSSSPEADTVGDATGPGGAAPSPAPAPKPAPVGPPSLAPSPPAAPSAPRPAAPGPRGTEPARFMAVEAIPPGMPRPGFVLEVPGAAGAGDAAGTATKQFFVGQPLGKGAYATTYELLDEFGAPTEDVVKFLRRPFEESDAWMRDRLELLGEARKGDKRHLQRLLRTQPAFDDTPMRQLIDRMMHGQRLLKDARIPYLEMRPLDDALARVGYDDDFPFVVQRRIPTDGSVVLCKVEQSGLPEAGMGPALVELYRKLADAGLVWKDGHVENVYFQRVGEGWVAGVLDADMIVKWDDAIENRFLRAQVDEVFRNDAARIKSLDRRDAEDPLDALDLDAPAEAFAAAEEARELSERVHRDVAGSPQEFMAKMLEYWKWIEYNPYRRARAEAEGRVGEFIDGRIDLASARAAFADLDQWVRRRPSPY